MKRILSALTALLFLFTNAQAAPADCEALLSRQPYRQKIRDSVRYKYSQMIFTTPAQNRKFIGHSRAAQQPHVFFWVENWMMKELNDTIIKNKELVTALTNLYKEIFLKTLARRLPGLEYDLYSDFKALGFALPAPVSAETLAALEAVFAEASVQFKSSKVLTQIARPGDVTAPWFKAGFGDSDVKAAWAARYAREDAAGRHVVRYSDADVQEYLQKQLDRFHRLHADLAVSAAALLEPGTGQFQTGVFAAARKAESDAQFAKSLELNFKGPALPRATVARLREYVAIANAFSPNLLIEKREAPDLAYIPFGAISLDFINLGAANLKASAKALIQARDLEDAAKQVRATEREVTSWLEDLKLRVRAEVDLFFAGQARLTLTGDDGTIELTAGPARPREQMELLNRLARLESKNFLRMAAIAEQPAAENPSELLNHGEKVEKILRQKILTELGPEFSQAIDISVLIYGEGQTRSVQLILNPRRPPTAADVAVLKRAFETSLSALEAELARKGSAITYEPLDIYAMRKVLSDQRHLLSPVVVPGYGYAPAR